VFDHDLRAEVLVALLLLEDLADDAAVRIERAVHVLAQVKRRRGVIAELHHAQFEKALRERNGCVRLQPLAADRVEVAGADFGVDRDARFVVLEFLDRVADHRALERQMRYELERVAERMRRRELAVGLATNHLGECVEVSLRHLFAALNAGFGVLSCHFVAGPIQVGPPT